MYSEPSEKQRLSSWWPKQRNNAAGQEYSGTPIPLTFKLAARLANPKPAGDPRRVSQKKRRSRLGYVAGTNRYEPRVRATSPDFSLLNTGHRFSDISDVGLEARVARMRGRIRGAERWNLAGRDDVHCNPDRSSRLLYCSRS